jgi:ribosomal protein L32
MIHQTSASVGAASAANGTCEQCGHDWNAHRLCGYGDPPTEGWIECPVEGCACKSSWSLPPEVAEQVEAQGE